MARRGSMRRGGGFGTGAIIGIVGITALGSIALTLALTNPRGVVSTFFNDALSSTANVVSKPVRWVEGGVDWVSSVFVGSSEVRKLRDENAALMEWRDQAKAMAERLDSYEKLHSVQNESVQGGVTARLVSETHGPFSHSGIINAGKNQGIGANWIVVNQYGLVGRVISLGTNSSRVLLLTDSQSRIPVMGEVSRGRAMLIGDKSDAPYLEHLNVPAIIGDGERLLTSGDDGVIPRGIAIGAAGRAPDSKWRVRLNSNAGAIDFVRIIPANNFPPPLERATSPGATSANSAIGGQIMPLDPNAAAIPTSATPSAISQAQSERAKSNSAQNSNATKTKEPRPVVVQFKDKTETPTKTNSETENNAPSEPKSETPTASNPTPQ